MTGAFEFIRSQKLMILFCFSLLAIMVMPYGQVYQEETVANGNGSWSKSYLLEDPLSMLIYSPLAFLCILVLALKDLSQHRSAVYLLTGYSGLISIAALWSSAMPAQDYMPSWGNWMALALGPLMLTKLITDRTYSR
jgi:hypothetical protein